MITLTTVSPGLHKFAIRDDGVGFPDDFDLDTVDTLGLQMVKGLVEEQLNGKLEMLIERGTVWEITFQRQN